jgi:glutamine amidotransferase
MWMHNGNIAQFSKIKRRLQSVLDDDLFNFVQGNTDSEWAFALFLTQLDDPHKQQFTSRELKDAMLKTIALLNQWAIEAGVSEPSFLNFAVTDGRTAICTRYINHKTKEAASLYFSSGSRFEMYKPGHYRMVKADKREDMVVIASEPLTFEKTDWLPIPSNTVAVVTANMNVLLYPVQDAYSCVNNKRESWE